MGRTLTLPELGPYLDRFQHRLFRMEALPAYAVTSDGDDFHRWLAGEQEPTWDRKRRWMDTLRAERAAGKVSARVRLLSADLTDYELYSCEWGYALNAEAGEDIRVLRRGEHHIPDGVIADDFWTIDDTEAVVMNYEGDGTFTDAYVSSTAGVYFAARDAAWGVAEPFGEWWARHAELHRRLAV